jgi:RNA polymerase sigma-70 factor (ECF subfamily)
MEGEADADLLARVSRGDREAWDRFVSLHQAFALGLARARLRRAGFGHAEADEVVQEVWLTLLKDGRMGRINPAQGFRPYLARAVLNAARDWLRADARRGAREVSRPPRPSPEAPDEPLLRREEGSRLESALAVLLPRDRLLLRLIYWEGLGYAAAARILGISPNGVGPLLTRLRQ